MTEPSPSLAANPDTRRWLELRPDGTVLVRSGKVELGQGLLTALAQIVADELDIAVARVRMLPAETGSSPDEGYTAGSLSVQHSGSALRAVSASLRANLLAVAAVELGTTTAELLVEDGEIRAPDGAATSYWKLAAFVEPGLAVGVTAKPAAAHRLVGHDIARIDIPGKVFGTHRYVHDLRFPRQLFGRVLRPPGRGALLVDIAEDTVRGLPGVVAVVRDGDFVGVVADSEYGAVRALAALPAACRWERRDTLPDERAVPDFLTSARADENLLHDSGIAASPGAATVSARFTRPYLAHASIAPSCAVARWHGGHLEVWSHTQGVYNLRAELARWFGLEPDSVRVEHVDGAGCYGHNAADDVAGDAALLAAAVPGRHVQVVLSREDELGWAPFGPAMAVQVDAELDGDGAIRHWRQEIWSNGHSSRPSGPGRPPLLAALHQGRPSVVSSDPPLARGGGSGRNAVPGYDLPGLTVVSHLLREMPLRTSALRGLGAHLNVYAIESVIDELAELAGRDPVDYRLRHLSDPRGRRVLERVAEAVDWGTEAGGPDSGRGVGYARYKNTGGYCAVVADIEARASVLVTRLTIAVDVGLVVNPDGVRNQIEGGALQSLSWTTQEQVRFDRHDVTSRTWEDYPILSFTKAPPVEVHLIDRPDRPALGAGEASIGPTAAAIGNAVRAALGVGVRTLPLIPENIIASL
jgi:CO/xanthine dehydrogenase Mo-binding subunit